MDAEPDFSFEEAGFAEGARIVCGVDEVGRGPLAGPVTAAAVILDLRRLPQGLNDSKLLTPQRRAELDLVIRGVAEVSIGHASVEEIDRMNILRASHLAMLRAIAGLSRRPCLALIDGNMTPREIDLPARTIINGDGLCLSIAAASIVAKMCRDRVMWDLAQHHPGYGWETNVGYSSRAHHEALRNLGVTPHHRRSFRPVHNILYQDKSLTT